RSHASTCRALRMSPSQGFIDRIDQFFIVEDLVGPLHPWLPPILDRRIEKALRDLPLSVVSFDHGSKHLLSTRQLRSKTRAKITFRHCQHHMADVHTAFRPSFLRRKVVRTNRTLRLNRSPLERLKSKIGS